MRISTSFSGCIVLFLALSCSTGNTVEESNGVYTDKYSVDDSGRKHGEFRRFFGDTLAELSNYQHGLLDGKRTIYHKEGWAEIIENYVLDSLHGPYRVFDSTGQVKIEGEYDHGVMRGIWKRYYPGGRLLEEVTYEDNAENGPFTEYYENGNLKAKGHYLGGDFEQDSLFLYSEDGQLERMMLCNNGICNTIWRLEEDSDEG